MKNKGQKPKKETKGRFRLGASGQFLGQIMIALFFLVLLVAGYSALVENKKETIEIPFSDLANKIQGGQVESVKVVGDKLEVVLKDKTIVKSKKESESSLVAALLDYGVKPEKITATRVEIANNTGWGYWILNLLPFVIPILFLLLFLWLISRQMKGASMQAFTFGQSRARIIDPNDSSQKVMFKDVAGNREAKEELLEIVDFLKNPKKFLEIGARIPKGALLMGAPGTGKTLLARAVAGEAHVPFFYLSGSEFVEMFVGVGASRVRDLFKMAKNAAPAIIFIDEIDAIGRHRGSGMGGGNDEREQTLNQILVEMDGFEPTEKLIVMAATNRPDVLDKALLRPGRFDRRVILDAPDINDREAILKIHATKKPLAEDVNIRVIAQRTPGFSGADLANLMNEAAILAAREDRKTVGQYDLVRSVEKVMLGPERKSHILSEKEKEITAYHEIGHALIASVLPHADPVHKVSIISRGHAAGYTLKLPIEDKKLNSKNEFLDDIAVSLGGYAVEQMIFGDITTGASNDIQVATSLARAMVTRYGMSEKVGPIDFGVGTVSHIGEVPLAEKSASEATWAIIDEEVSALMKNGLARAQEVLTNYRAALDSLSKELVRTETLERAEFEVLLKANGIEPKVDKRIAEEVVTEKKLIV